MCKSNLFFTRGSQFSCAFAFERRLKIVLLDVLDVEHFNVKLERSVWRNHTTSTTGAIAKVPKKFFLYFLMRKSRKQTNKQMQIKIQIIINNNLISKKKKEKKKKEKKRKKGKKRNGFLTPEC